ncbi:MAG: hypothetical protein R3F19_31860 [Verrucomicrobiales bacterium]
MKYTICANLDLTPFRIIHWLRIVASCAGLVGISASATAQNEGYYPVDYEKVDRSLPLLDKALPEFTFDNANLSIDGQAVFDYHKDDQAVSIILYYAKEYDSEKLRAQIVGSPITDWERPDKDIGDAESWTWTRKADKTTPSAAIFRRGTFVVRLGVDRGIDVLATARAIDRALENGGVDRVMAQIKNLEGWRSRPTPLPVLKPDLSAPDFLQAITPEGWILANCSVQPEYDLISSDWVRVDNAPAPDSVDHESPKIRLDIYFRSKEERESGLVVTGGGPIFDYDLRYPRPREGQPQLDEGRFQPDSWFSVPEYDGRQNPNRTSFLFMRGLTTAGVWANIPLAESMPFIEAVDAQLKKLGDIGIRDQIAKLRERKAQEARAGGAAMPKPEPPLTAAEQAEAVQILIKDLDDPSLSSGTRQKALLMLSHTGAKESLPVFLAHLDAKYDRGVRSRAIQCLGRLGAPEGIEQLAAILEREPVGDTSVPWEDEPSEAIERRAAANAIGAIGGKESLPLLRKLADRTNEYFTVGQALQQMVGDVERKTKE